MSDPAGHANSIKQMREARSALMRAAKDDPERWWTAEELRRASQNGFPSTILSAALNDLVESHKLRLNNRLHIQYVQ
jgi:hypothetical protein